jgi:hypothetical protein
MLNKLTSIYFLFYPEFDHTDSIHFISFPFDPSTFVSLLICILLHVLTISKSYIGKHTVRIIFQEREKEKQI